MAKTPTLARLLDRKGILSAPELDREPNDAIRRWASSGGMYLTGHPEVAPCALPAGALAAAEEAAALVAALGGPESVVDELPTLLFGRAALYGLARRGRVSAGGTCRLLCAEDGWIAINLARPNDVASVAAIVGYEPTDPWQALTARASRTPASELVELTQLLGVASAVLAGSLEPSHPVTITPIASSEPGSHLVDIVVVDLSSLWAGPLCAYLLARAGATVIKVESMDRVDGTRSGATDFFDWLHGGHRAVALDFRSPHDLEALRRLISHADVVIESSRPRGLSQFGIEPEMIRAGAVWLSITGYGRTGDAARKVAFGDDAAVAGGLVCRDQDGDPVFCADAVADPLTGLYAAAAVLACLRLGGGLLAEVVMSQVALHAVARAGTLVPNSDDVRVRLRAPDLWQAWDGFTWWDVLPPQAPIPVSYGPTVGHDTDEIVAALRGLSERASLSAALAKRPWVTRDTCRRARAGGCTISPSPPLA